MQWSRNHVLDFDSVRLLLRCKAVIEPKMVSDCNGSKSAVELWLQSTSSTHFGERSNAGAILLTGQSSDRVFWGYSLSQRRSEERSVGKECVSTCRSRRWAWHKK